MNGGKRKRRRWILPAAAALILAGCAIVYASGGGSGIPEIPGGFALQIYVLEPDGAVTRRDVRDASQISAVQQYIRGQAARRLTFPADTADASPCIGFSDGEGSGARRAAYTGGVWIDRVGRCYAVELDLSEILRCVPNAAPEPATLRDFPNRFFAASLSGEWDPKLLEPAETLPAAENFIVRARERQEDKLSITVYNPGEAPILCDPETRLDVWTGGGWYAVPPDADHEQEASRQAAIEPQSTMLFTALIGQAEARYGALPAGHYRLVLLTYMEEFDVG